MILFPAIIIFLFSLYSFAKDDFVFLRKNVSLTVIFDITFFVGIAALFCSRIVYVASHFSFLYINPLVFFVIPYFPGLSASGLLLGGSITLYAIAMGKKLPLGKLFDIFSLSVGIAFGWYFLEKTLLLLLQKNYLKSGEFVLCALIVLVLIFLLQKLATRSSWKDGSTSLLVLTLVGLTSFVINWLSPEFPYFLTFLLLLFVSFLIKTFKNNKK